MPDSSDNENRETALRSAAGTDLMRRQSTYLLDRMVHGPLALPRTHAKQKEFVRFLRRAARNPQFVRGAEALRDHVLRSLVKKKQDHQRGLVLAVCGARGDEDASLVSLLLALSLGASPHWRVGYMDGRFNRERFEALSRVLSLSRNACVIRSESEFLEGHYNEGQPNVYFLDNPRPAPSLEFFSDAGLADCLAQLRATFAFTVIDMPPLLEASSNNLLAPLADRLYLVTSAGKTRLGEVERCVKVTADLNTEISGVVITRQKAPFWSRFFWREYFF